MLRLFQFRNKLSVFKEVGTVPFSTAVQNLEELKKSFLKPGVTTSVNLSDEVMTSHSLSTANSQDIMKYKIGKHVTKFKVHDTDTGSSTIQSMH